VASISSRPGGRACALGLGVAIALATIGAVATANTPLPARDDRSVHDTADVITPADEASLETINRELFQKTGVAIVVITVPTLVDETIDQFAVRVGQTWGVGDQARDRGLVIALSRDDREIYVATGYGTEGQFNDAKVGALIDREAVPALRQNRFSDGLTRLDRAFVAEVAAQANATITGVEAPPPERPVRQSGGSGLITLLGIVVFFIIAMRHPWLLMFFGGFGGGGFGGRRGGGGRDDDSGFGGFGGGGFGGGGAGRGF
jgi:uncharacterized protein